MALAGQRRSSRQYYWWRSNGSGPLLPGWCHRRAARASGPVLGTTKTGSRSQESCPQSNSKIHLAYGWPFYSVKSRLNRHYFAPLQGYAAPLLASSGIALHHHQVILVSTLSELLQHFLVESWNISRLAASHYPVVHHYLFVHPLRPRVFQIGLQRGPGSHRPATTSASISVQGPWQMAATGLPSSKNARTNSMALRSSRSLSGFITPPGSTSAS